MNGERGVSGTECRTQEEGAALSPRKWGSEDAATEPPQPVRAEKGRGEGQGEGGRSE